MSSNAGKVFEKVHWLDVRVIPILFVQYRPMFFVDAVLVEKIYFSRIFHVTHLADTKEISSKS